MTNDEAKRIAYKNMLSYLDNRSHPNVVSLLSGVWDGEYSPNEEQRHIIADTFIEVANFVREKMNQANGE